MNYNTDAATANSALYCLDPSLAQQQFREESDINFIANRYGLTGELPQVLDLPAYQDFEGIYDFQTAQHVVIKAREQFMTLPAKMRARFDNDPQKLLTFLEDPENRAEADFLGLTKAASGTTTTASAAPATQDKGETPTPATGSQEASTTTDTKK